jgi:tRNA dimethylallyltransferase
VTQSPTSTPTKSSPPLPSPLIVLLGPTAVGKTELSLRLAERIGGEIVSADSRQVYRGMDIGTAKASADERQRVPHHLIDIRSPDQPLSVAEYQFMAYATIDAIHRRQAVPFLVGGTALYLRAVVLGLRIPSAPPDAALRTQLEARLSSEGVAALFSHLQEIDPATAAVTDARNPRRVLRALEIILSTGRSKVEMEGADPPPYRILQIGLQRERETMHRRVDARIDEMIADGLVEETERLLAAGYDPALPALTSLGYREIGAFLAGEISLPHAVERIKIETHRFLRHQSTWFRKMEGVVWFDLDDAQQNSDERIFACVEEFLYESG